MSEARSALPGQELVDQGLADLAAGRETVPALVVMAAAPRLRALGLDIPSDGAAQASHRLYALLAQDGDDAHSRYNALVGRIVSFARAAEHAAAG